MSLYESLSVLICVVRWSLINYMHSVPEIKSEFKVGLIKFSRSVFSPQVSVVLNNLNEQFCHFVKE